MAITYLPDKLLKRLAPKKKVEKLMSSRLTLNRAVLSTLSGADFMSKKTLENTALKVIKQYKASYQDERDDGTPATEAKEEAINDKKLLVNRVQNSVVNQIAGEIKSQYRGEYYTWLPSDAEEPDPLHQLNYGQTFQVGKGEMPGDRYGCRCGMEIQVDETELEL